MDYSTKNYMEQGGDRLVIGGELVIEEGAVVTGLPTPALQPATPTALGGVKVAAPQADSVATDAAALVTEFNALLAKLRAAGLMAGS